MMFQRLTLRPLLYQLMPQRLILRLSRLMLATSSTLIDVAALIVHPAQGRVRAGRRRHLCNLCNQGVEIAAP